MIALEPRKAENAEDSKEFAAQAAGTVDPDTQGRSVGDAWRRRECVGEVTGYSLLPCKLKEG